MAITPTNYILDNVIYYSPTKANKYNVDLTITLEHELGHAIGLNHIKESINSIMRPARSVNDNSWIITKRDIQNVNNLYK